MTLIAHISDSHLSGARAYFFDNFEAMRGELAVLKPDLVVNTGDLTIDGVDSLDDLRFAYACHERLGFPWRAVPGNHDVGEEGGGAHLDQPTTTASLARYRGVFGADWWFHDVPGWRLIGLNSQVFGLGLPDEEAQWAFLQDAVADTPALNLGLFIHKPFWGQGPSDPADPVWHITPLRRERLLAMLGARLRFIATGHLHQGWIRDFGGVRHVWGPSCGFPAGVARGDGACTAVGYALLRLAPDGGFSAELRQSDAFVQHDYKALKAGAPFLKDGPVHQAPIAW